MLTIIGIIVLAVSIGIIIGVTGFVLWVSRGL